MVEFQLIGKFPLECTVGLSRIVSHLFQKQDSLTKLYDQVVKWWSQGGFHVLRPRSQHVPRPSQGCHTCRIDSLQGCHRVSLTGLCHNVSGNCHEIVTEWSRNCQCGSRGCVGLSHGGLSTGCASVKGLNNWGLSRGFFLLGCQGSVLTVVPAVAQLSRSW